MDILRFDSEIFIPFLIFAIPIVAIVGGITAGIVRTLGRGNTAEEALQIALFCITTSRGAREALTLAVAHEGDTDAIASLVGAALGTIGGVGALPQDWLAQLELRREIETLADDLLRARFVDPLTAFAKRYPASERAASRGSGARRRSPRRP